jgi:hypothetical protein
LGYHLARVRFPDGEVHEVPIDCVTVFADRLEDVLLLEYGQKLKYNTDQCSTTFRVNLKCERYHEFHAKKIIDSWPVWKQEIRLSMQKPNKKDENN